MLIILLAGLVIAGSAAAVLGLKPLDPSSWDSSQAARRESQRPTVQHRAGELDRLIGAFAEALTRRSAYREPRATQAARLADAFRAIRAGALKRAAARADPLGYRVIRFRDVDTGRMLVLLAERRDSNRGWGLYVHSPLSRSRLIVEAVHPGSDVKSELVAAEVFRRADAAGLFVAGALRDAGSDGSADVAHSRGSPFETVHRVGLSREAIVLQPHGFDSSERGVEYGEIVLSSGGPPTPIVRSLARRLRTGRFDTCLYRRGHCEGLGGTRNTQGRSTRAAGAAFVHLELARRLRESSDLRARLARTLTAVLAPRR